MNAASWSSGGFVGDANFGNVNVSKSFNKGSVNNASGNVGGLVGSTEESDVTIEDCFNAGFVSGNDWNIGGLLGNVSAEARAAQISIANSYNTGVVVHLRDILPTALLEVLGRLRMREAS